VANTKARNAYASSISSHMRMHSSESFTPASGVNHAVHTSGGGPTAPSPLGERVGVRGYVTLSFTFVLEIQHIFKTLSSDNPFKSSSVIKPSRISLAKT
jgi:hypothetical protein